MAHAIIITVFDLTTLWAWLQKNKQHAGKLIVALLIFAVGWQTGKVMSPYYTAHPIIFEDKPCENQASSGGSQEELVDLQQQGRGVTPSPKTAAAETTAAVAGTTEKLFVGSVNSNLYHHKDCSTANRIKEENKIWFATTEEGEAAGYSPSKCTRQKLGL